jgi:septal ring-binding cell division protein DamX
MPTMTRQEASAYMFFLIKSEGLSEKLALDEVKLNRLYRETGGNPGELATAILSAVGEGGDKRRDGFGLGGYRKQLLIGGIPLLLIIIILFSVGPISSLFGPEVDSRPDEYADKEIAPLPVPAATAISQPEPLTESARIETPAPMQVDVTAGETGEVQRGSIVEEQPLLAQEADQVTMSTDVPESIGKGEAASGSAGKPDGPGSVETGDEPVKATDSADASAGISVEAVTGGVQNAVAEAVEPVADERQQEQPDVTAEAGPGEIKAPPTEDLPIPDRVETKRVSEARQAGPDEEVAMAESSPAQMVAAGDEEPEWVMSRSPENYTLQLIAVENLDSLKGFVDRHRLHKETHTFEMSRKGKPWYALLWGDFPDRKSAMQAASTLPSAIQKAGVWARTFGSLQKSKAQ